jgi:hypothetical protein
METLALAVLFGGVLIYGLHIAGRACRSDHMAIRHDGKGLLHEL